MEIQLGNTENDRVVIEDTYGFALRIMAQFANITAEAVYRWSDEGFRKNVNNTIEKGRENLMRDPTFWSRIIELPNELRHNLGFRYWDDEPNVHAKMLMPFWIYTLLPMDFAAGGKKKRDVDDRTLFGCVLWPV